MAGWIKLHRCLKDKAIFQNEKLLKVFIWCILKATHSKHEQLVGRQKVALKPGQFITGRKKAGLELDMAPSTAWGYLKLLEDNSTINIESSNRFSVVTIVNWEMYQSENKKSDNKWSTDEQQETTVSRKKRNSGNSRHDSKLTPAHTDNTGLGESIHSISDNSQDSKQTTDEQQMDTNKNVKNDNNNSIYILTESENQFLNTLSQIKNYPLDREKDLEMYKALTNRYPQLDPNEAIEQWRVYKLDKPLTEKSNPRSQINMAFKKYLEWNKCLKGASKNATNQRDTARGTQDWGGNLGNSKLFTRKLG